jgi:hypothetical protein
VKIYFALILLLSASGYLTAQNHWLRKDCINLSGGRFQLNHFDEKYLYLSYFGSIKPNNTYNFNLNQDIFYQRIYYRKKLRLQFELGHFTNQYLLVPQNYFVGPHINRIYQQNSGFSTGAEVGKRLFDRRKFKIYAGAGIDYEFIRFFNDYSPIDYVIQAFFTDETISSLINQQTYSLLNTYFTPNFRFSGNFHFELYSNILTLGINYCNRHLQINTKSLDDLFKSSTQFQLSYTFIFHYSYR